MTCHEALRLLEFARPGATELDAADIAALETHLAGCTACGHFARLERVWDDQVAAAMHAVPPPAVDPAGLLQSLRSARRHWWRWLGLTAATAGWAGVVIWTAIPAPRFDAEAVAERGQIQAGNAEGAASWLRAENARFGFPPRFRPRYLIRFERQAFYGVTTPVLTFVRGGTLARVAVLNERDFRNLRSLPDGPVADSSSCSVTLVRDPDRPGVVYVIEAFNGPVEPMYDDPDAAT